MANAFRDDTRLPRARACDDEQRPIAVLDGAFLRRVHVQARSARRRLHFKQSAHDSSRVTRIAAKRKRNRLATFLKSKSHPGKHPYGLQQAVESRSAFQS